MAWSKMLWQTGTVPVMESWDYWTSVRRLLFRDSNSQYYYKDNPKIAYYVITRNNLSYYQLLLLSTDPDAVTCSNNQQTVTYMGTVSESVGPVWYWSCIGGIQFNYIPDYCMSPDKFYPGTTQQSGPSIARDLLNRIYAVPFHEDYQVNTTYTLNTTDIRKTIRKGLGLALSVNIVFYNDEHKWYKTLSDSADTIINDIMSQHGSGTDKLFGMYALPRYALSGFSIMLISCDLNDGNLRRLVGDKYRNFYTLDTCPIPSSAPSINRYGLFIDSNGDITSNTENINPYLIGISGMFDYVLISNWGIDL